MATVEIKSSFYFIVLLRNSDKWLTISWSSVLLGKLIVIRVPKCDYLLGNDTGRRRPAGGQTGHFGGQTGHVSNGILAKSQGAVRPAKVAV